MFVAREVEGSTHAGVEVIDCLVKHELFRSLTPSLQGHILARANAEFIHQLAPEMLRNVVFPPAARSESNGWSSLTMNPTAEMVAAGYWAKNVTIRPGMLEELTEAHWDCAR